MDGRQRLALEDPCGRAPDTVKPKFWQDERARDAEGKRIKLLIVTTGLTVNR